MVIFQFAFCRFTRGYYVFQYIPIFIYLTATSLESWLIREIIPKWPYFRLVNYYNSPINIYIYIYIYIYANIKYKTPRVSGTSFLFFPDIKIAHNPYFGS